MFDALKKFRANRKWDERCFQLLAKNVDHVCFYDLPHPIELTDRFGDTRTYVARGGLFTEDLMTVNIPKLTWYVRPDGNIWTEWQLLLYRHSDRWHKFQKDFGINAGGRYLSEKFDVKMSTRSTQYIQKLMPERWVLHKLGSDRLTY